MKPPELNTWQAILLGFISGALVLAAVVYISLPDKMVPLNILPTASPAPITIHVAGAVHKPGLFLIAPNSRVLDAINAAGGAADAADLDQINLAAPIVDGLKIYVPQKGEINTKISSQGNIEKNNELIIHLNSATTSDFELLPGIGKEKAEAIVTEREKRIRFQSIDELLTVPGISENIFQKIQPFIILD
jgi:competence protein ComEA